MGFDNLDLKNEIEIISCYLSLRKISMKVLLNLLRINLSNY